MKRRGSVALYFEDPPDNPRSKKKPGRKSKWEEPILALKKHPGKWARLNDSPLTSGSAGNIARSIKWNTYTFLENDDDYDAEVRRMGDVDDDQFNVYVRYNGKKAD
jgi:hypothetical protein